MSKTKIIMSILLVLAVFALQTGVAFAAPEYQETTPISGTVDSIVLETDADGVTTVLVTYTDEAGASQTARLSVDTAVSLNLVTLDEAGNPVVNDSAIGTTVEIDPTTIIPDEDTQTEDQHPVGSALSDFFSSVLGIDYDTVMSTHDAGVGFGVIAQALWMTYDLGGDTELFNTIITAKQTGDYSAIVLPDGTSPKNWGQFRKALLDNKENLGQIMSGHAAPLTDETTTTTTTSTSTTATSNNGNGNGQGHGQGNGNGKGGGNGRKP